MKTPRTWVLLLVIGFVPAAVRGQAPPLGGEFRVNTFTTSLQGYPSVSSARDGKFVAVWESDDEDGQYAGVFGQRYDGLGQHAGSEFQVNSYTTGFQYAASVAATGGGAFVVVWTSDGQDGDGDGVFGQRFASNGSKTGPEFQVNTYTTGYQGYPQVAADAQGNFVVVWSSYGQDGSELGVFGQRFDKTGTKLGAEFSVNSYTTGRQNEPAIGMDPSGNFVVVWMSFGQDGSTRGVFGQRFDASGQALGQEFPVNTATTGDQQSPSIKVDGRGNFVVAWADNGPPTDGEVLGQRFDASGEKVGAPFQANTYTTGLQDSPALAMDRNGNFLVVWTSHGQDGSMGGIFGQRFDRHGDKIGGEFPLNTYTTGDQRKAAAADDGAGWVVTWASDGEDGDQLGVFGRRQILHPEGLAVDARSSALTSSDANGVLEPGESVLVEPTWSNNESLFVALTGTTPATFCFIGFPCVMASDGSADYGSMPPDSVASCNDGSPDACYVVSASGPRPGVHWDGAIVENLSAGGGQLWTLHVGDSFSDVPRSEPFYRKIETLLHNGITSGCGGTQYCPGTVVNRDQMGIFIAKGIAGLGELVPAAGSVSGSPYDCSPGGVSLFTDVSPTDSFCRHVHYLAAENVTLGCGGNSYCPGQSVTRDAMASFIAKAIVAPGGGNAVPLTYGPDPVTGFSYSCDAGSPNTHFTDVPVSNPFCKHIHFLWAKGIVSGCSATQYCPTQTVARDAMAKFIANGFGLQLYAP